MLTGYRARICVSVAAGLSIGAVGIVKAVKWLPKLALQTSNERFNAILHTAAAAPITSQQPAGYKATVALLLLVSGVLMTSTTCLAETAATVTTTTLALTPSAQSATTTGRKTITFSCAITAGSPAYTMAETFYRNVFDRLDYDFTMTPLPLTREASEIAMGHYDGSCGRTSNPILSQLPHLIKIDQPIARFSLELIATKASPEIKDLEDLPPGSSIAYVRGSTTLEAKLKKYPQLNSFPAPTENSALKMLIANRVDFYLRGKTPNNKVFFEPDVAIPLHVVINWDLYYLYPYLHARHSELKPALQDEIKRQLQAYPDNYLSLPSAK